MFSSTALLRAYRSILFPWKQNLLAHLVFFGEGGLLFCKGKWSFIACSEFSSVFSSVFQFALHLSYQLLFVLQKDRVRNIILKVLLPLQLSRQSAVLVRLRSRVRSPTKAHDLARDARQQNSAKVLKWSTRVVCKTTGPAYEGSNPSLGTVKKGAMWGKTPPQLNWLEHLFCKQEVPGSIPGGGSRG